MRLVAMAVDWWLALTTPLQHRVASPLPGIEHYRLRASCRMEPAPTSCSQSIANDHALEDRLSFRPSKCDAIGKMWICVHYYPSWSRSRLTATGGSGGCSAARAVLPAICCRSCVCCWRMLSTCPAIPSNRSACCVWNAMSCGRET